MIDFLKKLFYTALFFGVIGSFCLRCSSTAPKAPKSEEVSSVESEPVAAPEVKAEKVALSAPAKKLQDSANGEAFELRAEQILKNLPTNDVIKSNHLNEDHHDTPKSIVASGRLMGEVMDKMKSDPKNIPSGMKFYEKCSDNPDIVLQVKALCLRNLRDWQTKLGQKSGKRFSKDVERLASQLPKTRFD